MKGSTNAESFGERHNATIAVREEIGLHVVLHQAATADTPFAAGARSPLRKTGNIGAVLCRLAFDGEGFLGTQSRLADPILE